MSSWMTAIAVPLTILTANIGVQIYFKWVPDIEDQKRQFKRVASWVFDILTVAVQVVSFYLLALDKGPITGGFVVKVSLFAGLAAVSLLLTVIRRIFPREHLKDFFDLFRMLADESDRHRESFRDLLSFIRSHVDMTNRHEEALTQLLKAPNLPAEIVESVQQVLKGPHRPTEAPSDSPAIERGQEPKQLQPKD